MSGAARFLLAVCAAALPMALFTALFGRPLPVAALLLGVAAGMATARQGGGG